LEKDTTPSIVGALLPLEVTSKELVVVGEAWLQVNFTGRISSSKWYFFFSFIYIS